MDTFYMIVLYAILLGIIFVLVYYTRFNTHARSRRQAPASECEEISMDIELLGDAQRREDKAQDRFYSTSIADVSYHCKTSDADVFVGFVTSQPDILYGKDSLAVINRRGKLLGYIAKKEHEDFRKWSHGKTVPCVGHIFVDEGGTLHSNLKCIRPYTLEFIQTEIKKYTDWWKKNILK